MKRSDMTLDEAVNRHAEWHGKPPTEDDVRALLQSMHDELDYIDGLPPLRREVLTGHLVPRKMTYCELKQDILIPLMLTGIAVSMFGLFL
jgi:hypothetical protein